MTGIKILRGLEPVRILVLFVSLIMIRAIKSRYIMRNVGLEETQAGIKIAGRNIKNLRYADDTTLIAESEEEIKSLLIK